MFRRWVDISRLADRCKPCKCPLLVALLLAVLEITGCTHATKPDPGKFLTDYAQLHKSKDAQSHVYFTHRMARSASHDYATYAVSVSYFPADARFAVMGAETQASVLAYLKHEIRQRIKEKALLASSDDQADIRLRVAITSVSTADPGMKPWDFLPFRLLTKPVKDEIMGAPKVASATLEEQTLDARTGAILNESVREDDGKSIGRQKQGVSVVTFELLRPVLDQWASSVVSELTSNKS
jgi:Protein of unknown function (DUF3313)